MQCIWICYSPLFFYTPGASLTFTHYLKAHSVKTKYNNMGCVHSRLRCFSKDDSLRKPNESIREAHLEEKQPFVHSKDPAKRHKNSMEASVHTEVIQNEFTSLQALKEYAQKMSEEIVAHALHVFAKLDSCYRDIPYIESDET